jgi:hypothetical protein
MAMVMRALLALVLVIVVLGRSRQARQDLERLQASVDGQREQARRFAEGWTPALWEEEASEDEKAEAVQQDLEEVMAMGVRASQVNESWRVCGFAGLIRIDSQK